MKTWHRFFSLVLVVIGVVAVWLGRYDQAAANFALAILEHLWSKEAA